MSQNKTITIASNITEYFEQVVTDAMRVRHVEASTEATTYLVGLLTDFAHPNEAAEYSFSQPLTFLLRDAMDASGEDRFRRLRGLGDAVLYTTGFFSGYVETSGVDKQYIISVGTTAYSHAASMLRMKTKDTAPNVLSEIAGKFIRFTEVLADVSDGTIACSSRDERSIVKMYERWLKTGSSRIAEELGSCGILPSKVPAGLN